VNKVVSNQSYIECVRVMSRVRLITGVPVSHRKKWPWRKVVTYGHGEYERVCWVVDGEEGEDV